MNVSFTAELPSFISEKVASGRYGSASEVVRTSLRLLGKKQPCPLPTSSSTDQADTARYGP